METNQKEEKKKSTSDILELQINLRWKVAACEIWISCFGL